MTTPTVYHKENGIGISDGSGFGGFIVNYVRAGFHCINAANPDIGGIGNVLSAVVQTLLTTTALILVTCFHAKISQRWSYALTTFISTSGDTAAFVGFSLLISAFVNLPLTSDRNSKLLHFQDAYFTLCVYICAAFSSIHIASLLTLRQRYGRHPKTTALRLTLLLCFATLLTATVVLSRYAYEPCFVLMEIILVEHMHMSANVESVLEYVLPAAVMVYIFWISAWQYIRPDSKRSKSSPSSTLWRRILHFIIFSNRSVVIGLQTFSAIGSVIFIMLQKFTTAPTPTAQDRANGVGEFCSLNNKVDNAWAFGQACAMLLLLIPIYAAAEALWNPPKIEPKTVVSDEESLNESPEDSHEDDQEDDMDWRQRIDNIDLGREVEMWDLKRRRSSQF